MKINSRFLWIGMVGGLMCSATAGQVMGSAADALSAQVDSLAGAVTARVSNLSDRAKLLGVTTNIKTVLIPLLSAAQLNGDTDAGAAFTAALRIIGTTDIAATLNDYASAQALIIAFADVQEKVVQSSPTLVTAATLYYYFAYVSAALFALLTPPAMIPPVVAVAPKVATTLSKVAIVGIVVASLVAVGGVGALIYYLRNVRPRTKLNVAEGAPQTVADLSANKGIVPIPATKGIRMPASDFGDVVVTSAESIDAIEKPKDRVKDLGVVVVAGEGFGMAPPEEYPVRSKTHVGGAAPRITVGEAARFPERFVTLGTIPPATRVHPPMFVPPLPGSPDSSLPPSVMGSPLQSSDDSDDDRIPTISVGQPATRHSRSVSVAKVRSVRGHSVVDSSSGLLDSADGIPTRYAGKY